MDKLRVFSDPHVGVNRQAHTTMDSRVLMQQKASQQLRWVAVNDDYINICAGDLLDGAKVSYELLLDTFDICKNIQIVLGGNHDLSNSKKDTTAFDVLASFGRQFLTNRVGENYYEEVELEGGNIVLVPHHSSQTDFEATLQTIIEEEVKADVLFLHCTYDFDIDNSETALNLGKEDAELLLESFGHIFIGHEHKPSSHFDGRLIMVGSTMPFTMGEIADRYEYIYDFETHEVTRNPIWLVEDHAAELDWDVDREILENLYKDRPNMEFLRLTGHCASQNGPELTAFIASLWQTNPKMLMLENRVKVGEMEGTQIATKEAVLTDLSVTIEAELEGSDLEPYWHRYKEAV